MFEGIQLNLIPCTLFIHYHQKKTVPGADLNSQIIHLFSKYLLSPHGTRSSALDTGDVVQHSWNFCSNGGDKALFTPCTSSFLVGLKNRHILMGLMRNHGQLSLSPPLTFSLLYAPRTCSHSILSFSHIFVIACLYVFPVSEM